MKKILLSLIFIMSSIIMHAQHWTAVSGQDFTSSTIIYAQIDINGDRTTESTTLEIAAFIGNECRATATKLTKSNTTGSTAYALRVWGNDEDNGKTITFKMYYDGLEYEVRPGADITYDQETHLPVFFFLDAITGVKIPSKLTYYTELPLIKNLADQITLLYQNKRGNNVTLTNKSTLLSTLKYSWKSDNKNVSGSSTTISASSECTGAVLTFKVSGPDYIDEQFIRTATLTLDVSLPISFSFPSEIEVDKYGTTVVPLTDVVGILFDPAEVDVAFPLNNGIPAASAFAYEQGGKYYLAIYGNTVGQFEFSVYDRANLIGTSDNTLTVNAKMSLPDGWSWMSLYSVDKESGNVSLTDNNTDNITYKSWVADNLQDVRSQFATFYNDHVYGVYGDIYNFNANDGMYKVKTKQATTFYAGYDTSKGFAVTKRIKKGYNWFNNPYQFDIPLAQLNEVFTHTPRSGDKIIGKDGFAEYNGSAWESSADFLLKAGMGYMYYSLSYSEFDMGFKSDIEYTIDDVINSNVVFYLTSLNDAKVRQESPTDDRLWNYDAAAYSDNMAVVASLEGVKDINEYSIGAFVNGECRGEGKLSASGKMFINIAGNAGEKVTFRAINKETGVMSDINEGFNFAGCAGSLEAPVRLTLGDEVTGIESTDADNGEVTGIYDISGRRVSTMTKGIYVIKYNINGRTVTKKVIKN